MTQLLNRLPFPSVWLAIAWLMVLLAGWQYRLWFGDGGILEVRAYQQRMDQLAEQIKVNEERNQALYGEVLDLKQGVDAIEERARRELGMIKQGETFFQIISREPHD
ncbi:MAG: cell division protein FtsB [Methylococcales bacterium]|nr:cell division protein FtsB [Methylococcales bacterium]